MENASLAASILDTALNIAETDSWENLHLFHIAQQLDISLDQIRQHYPQKDDLVEAWFDRADSAVLNISPCPEFLNMKDKDRLHLVIMTWLETLAPHRQITKQMLYYKFEFGHIHLQALGIMRVSRTVQWFREAARIESTNLQRILEETATTSIYLMTFAYWLHDKSPASHKTRSLLQKCLR